jgi:hypothetical protein
LFVIDKNIAYITVIISTDLTEIKTKGKGLIRNKFIIKLENKIIRMQNSLRDVATGRRIWN